MVASTAPRSAPSDPPSARPDNRSGNRPDNRPDNHPDTSARDRRRNQPIEGLRGLSALLVLVYHLYAMAVVGRFFPPVAPHSLFHSIEQLGAFGVTSFFVISGYLITRSLREDGRVGRFLARRALRLYPLFVPLHVLAFALGPWLGDPWMRSLTPSLWGVHFASNLLFLPGVLDLPIAQKNAWSLSWEAAFYLLASLTCLALARRRRGTAPRVAMLSLVALASLALLFRSLDGAYFLIGVACALAPAAWLRAVSLRPAGALGLLVAFVAYRPSPALAIGGTLLAFASLAAERGWLAAALATRPLQRLGQVSYSLYLVHPFVLRPFKMLLARHPEIVAGDAARLIVFGVVGGGLSLVASYLAWRWFEVAIPRRLARAWGIRETEPWTACASPT